MRRDVGDSMEQVVESKADGFLSFELLVRAVQSIPSDVAREFRPAKFDVLREGGCWFLWFGAHFFFTFTTHECRHSRQSLQSKMDLPL